MLTFKCALQEIACKRLTGNRYHKTLLIISPEMCKQLLTGKMLAIVSED